MNVLSLPYKARVIAYQLLKLSSAVVGALFVVAPLFGWELPHTKLDAADQLIFAVISLLGLGAGTVATEHAKVSTDGPLQDPRVPVEPPVVPVDASIVFQDGARVVGDLIGRLEQLGKPKGE